MPKQKFKPTEGLLEDVMRKQSGVIQKAWLEALMNSVDANATEITFEITEDRTVIRDNGDSMTEDEVRKFFEHFGLKDSDISDKEFGKFRMGRGQIFNFGSNIWRAKENYMVVNLDEDATTVTLPNCTTEDDESIISVDGDEYTVDTEGLSYALLDAEEHNEGLVIQVEHYNPISDVEDAISSFKKLARYVPWRHKVSVEVNGEELYNEPEVIEETEAAFYVEESDKYTNRSEVYNKGAHVDSFSLGPKRLGVITKEDLDVTLDRTDILDSDDYWQEIKAEYEQIVLSELVEQDDITTEQRVWLLERASENVGLLEEIIDKPLIEDIEGDMWTISEISSKKLGFADKGDAIAQDAMAKSPVVMLTNDYEEPIHNFANKVSDTIEQSNLKSYEEVIEDDLAFEMDEVKDEDLSKRRMKNLRQLREALNDLGFSGKVKAGYSNHKKVWKNDSRELYIHKEYLNRSKNEIVTEVFFEVCKVAAHSGDTRGGIVEDFSLNREFYEIMNGDKFGAEASFPEVQRRLMGGEYE